MNPRTTILGTALAVACGASAALAGGPACPNPDHDCFSTGTPGCSDEFCCTTVCDFNPLCCDIEWDAECVALADKFCFAGTCPESDHDCFTAGDPGCTDLACCSAVCAVDAFCCDVAWDAICVGTALDVCDAPKAPANDNCVDAAEIALGDTAFSTIGATDDGPALPPECDEGFGTPFVSDVWYAFTATETNTLIVSTCNQASYDTRLAAYTGDCKSLALAACNDDGPGCAGFTSVMQLETTEGATYLLRVGGFAGFGSGTLTLTYGSLAPENDDCDAALEIGLGETDFSTNFASTDGPDLPPECDEGFGTPFVNDVWYSFTATETDTLLVSTCNAATYDTRLAAYTGDCGELELVGCNDDGAGCAGLTSLLELPTVKGESYLIRVGGFAGSGTGTLTLTYGSLGPDNDDCANAIVIEEGNTAFSTNFATTDGPDLPAECDEGFGTPFVNDIWYTFEATQTGPLTVSTCFQASYDTRLAAYTGDCDSLVLAACNDDGPGCPGFTSILVVDTTEGETYLIRVGGFAGSGTGTLTVSYGGGGTPENDNCDDATVLGDGVTEFSTIGASTDGPALPESCDEGFGVAFVNDVWFTYTPSCSGLVTVSTCDSASYDTRLAAYTGDCGALEFVGCNDDGDGCGGFTSILTFDATCGTTYLIRVGGFATSGTGTLTVFCEGKACGDCAADFDGNGTVDGADLGTLLGNWGGSGVGDLDNSGTVDGADLGILLGAWGDCP